MLASRQSRRKSLSLFNSMISMKCVFGESVYKTRWNIISLKSAGSSKFVCAQQWLYKGGFWGMLWKISIRHEAELIKCLEWLSCRIYQRIFLSRHTWLPKTLTFVKRATSFCFLLTAVKSSEKLSTISPDVYDWGWECFLHLEIACHFTHLIKQRSKFSYDVHRFSFLSVWDTVCRVPIFYM